MKYYICNASDKGKPCSEAFEMEGSEFTEWGIEIEDVIDFDRIIIETGMELLYDGKMITILDIPIANIV